MRKTSVKAYVILSILLAIAVACGIILLNLNKPLDRNNSMLISISVPVGASTEEIASTLEENNLIDSADHYKIISKLWRFDGKYLAGDYSLSPSMSKSDIGKMLISGMTDMDYFSVPEGLTLLQTAAALSEDGVVDYDSFVDRLTSGDYDQFAFLDQAQKGENHLEGFLFPETYVIDKGASEDQIICAMLDQFDTVVDQEYRDRAEELGYSNYEVLIVASLVEKEAKSYEDRAKLAGIIYSKLEEGVPLELDSSLYYITGNDSAGLTSEDPEIDSPYNTFINEGLPPGPICSPGKTSIMAALYPIEVKKADDEDE